MKTPHKKFNVAEKVYCILTSNNQPEFFIPIKAIIREVKWDPVNPKYMVDILKFYDSFTFLKTHFSKMNFQFNMTDKARPISVKINFDELKTLSDLYDVISDDQKSYKILVDSIMTFNTKGEMYDVFQDLMLFIISRNLKTIRGNASRSFYKGPLSIIHKNDFDRGMKTGFSKYFDDTDMSIDEYLRSLE